MCVRAHVVVEASRAYVFVRSVLLCRLPLFSCGRCCACVCCVAGWLLLNFSLFLLPVPLYGSILPAVCYDGGLAPQPEAVGIP